MQARVLEFLENAHLWLIDPNHRLTIVLALAVCLLIILFALRQNRLHTAMENIGLNRLRRESDSSALSLFTRPVLGQVEPEAAPAAAPAQDAPLPEAPAVATGAADDEVIDTIPPLLARLPFCNRPGLTTGHAERYGFAIEAVFFSAKAAAGVKDPAVRLIPFLPAGKVLYKESDRKTFSRGKLFSQPDAVIETADGLVALEYKSRGGRLDNRDDWADTLRAKDLFQTLIGAVVTAHALERPCAPVLRTNNAVYFLRPSPGIVSMVLEREAAARDFLQPFYARDGMAASDYAALLAQAARLRFPTNNDTGRAYHDALLG